MQLHLVDATYELFRAHYAPRPPVRGRDGVLLSGVAGLVWQILAMLRDEGATHLGCATDHVIESWRNEAYPGYKTSAGMPPELLAQFPIAEDAIRALGLVCWPMVEWEADDALATACRRWADDPAVERINICTPDKDMAQLVRGDRIVLLDRRRRITYDEPAVVAKWGVSPASIPDWLALVGDAADGYPGIPGWGAKSAAGVLAVYGSLDRIPRHASEWHVPGVRNVPFLAASLEENAADVRLYRELARLRHDAPLPERTPAELEWRGTPRDEWAAFCDRWGLDRLRDRPHRWRD
ncbi:MAG TPA: 5'-3' exonuclease H3TH domain-containing protein [Candidatus Limnocylindrales bacterium]|nr:5'-3' exonuclease H3TH domain-containing protein [Candidatus Limnocylindrales bacterium]